MSLCLVVALKSSICRHLQGAMEPVVCCWKRCKLSGTNGLISLRKAAAHLGGWSRSLMIVAFCELVIELGGARLLSLDMWRLDGGVSIVSVASS